MKLLPVDTLFVGIEGRIRSNIASDMQRRRYAAGDIIFREGDAGRFLYFIRSGLVRIYVHGWNGRETSIIIYGKPGDMFGEMAAIDGLPRSATAAALTNTELFTLSYQRFNAHMQRSPLLAINLLKMLTIRLRFNTQQVNTLSTGSVPQRLAQKLVELGQQHGRKVDNGLHINLPLTQDLLASLIGATRESTNKGLKGFQRQHWIHIQHRQITILNLEALQNTMAGAASHRKQIAYKPSTWNAGCANHPLN